MQKSFKCFLVSEQEPNLREYAPFDCVPRLGDFITVGTRCYRVLAALMVLSDEPNTGDSIFLSVDAVAIPKVFTQTVIFCIR